MSEKSNRHPLLRIGRGYMAIGGVGVALGVFAQLMTASAQDTLLCVVILNVVGGFLFWNGWALTTIGHAAPILHEATLKASVGKLDEAERLHAQMPPRVARRRTIARALNVQRASIALSRGSPGAAKRFANEALDSRTGLFTQGWDHANRIEALAIRAVAHAALEEGENAEADAREVEASPHARPAALARADLARAINLARKGDKATLGAHLVRRGNLILEYAMPRERALLRAFRALARSPGKSAYREQGRRDEEEGGGTPAEAKKKVRSWIEQVAPDAADFAPPERIANMDEALPPRIDSNAMRSIAESRRLASEGGQPKKKTWKRTLALWVILCVMFGAVWQFLTPPDTKTHADHESPPIDPAALDPTPYSSPIWLSVFLPLGLFAFGMAFVAWFIARYRRFELTLLEAERDMAIGRSASSAKEKLAKLVTVRSSTIIAAQARLQLAALANREGNFREAIAECDRGIAAVAATATSKAMASDRQMPGLITERAFALAALGRFPEAETELAQMTMAYPTYAFLASASFRIRLMTAVRMGDDAGAARGGRGSESSNDSAVSARANANESVRIAMSRTAELPLDLRTDLLADVILAESGEPMGTHERERIAAELRDLPEIAKWIDDVRKAEKVHVPPPPLPENGLRIEEEAPPSSSGDHDEYIEEEDMSPARKRRALQRDRKR